MKTCKKCKKSVPNNMKICKYCGTDLSSVKPNSKNNKSTKHFKFWCTSYLYLRKG